MSQQSPLTPIVEGIKGKFERRCWSWPWLFLLVAVNLISIGFLIYSYIEGKKGKKEYVPFYDLIHSPSWYNLKAWFASIMNNPVTEIFLMLIFVIIPFPFLRPDPHARLEYLFSKLGVYFLLATLILGKPDYKPDDPSSKPKNQIWTYVVIGAIVAIFVISWLYKRFFNAHFIDEWFYNC